MPHWRIIGQDGKTALQDLSGRLGRLETSDRDALEVQWRTSDFVAASPVPGSPLPRSPPRSASTPRRSSDGSSSGAFPTARIAGQPRRCWGPTRPTCGPSSPTSDAPRRPAPPSWSPSIPTAAPSQERCGAASWSPLPTASTCWSMPGCSRPTAIQRSPSCLPPRPNRGARSALPWEIRTPRRCVDGARKNRSEMAWPLGSGWACCTSGGDRRSWGRAALPHHDAVQLALPVR